MDRPERQPDHRRRQRAGHARERHAEPRDPQARQRAAPAVPDREQLLTTAVTNIPEIEVTNNPRDDLLYKNAQNHNTTDAGNKMAIASAARASKLFNPNNLATVNIWVEDDNDKTTTKTGFKSFTGTPALAQHPRHDHPGAAAVDRPGGPQGRRVLRAVRRRVRRQREPPRAGLPLAAVADRSAVVDRPPDPAQRRPLSDLQRQNDTLNIVHLAPRRAPRSTPTAARSTATFNTISCRCLHQAGDAANFPRRRGGARGRSGRGGRRRARPELKLMNGTTPRCRASTACYRRTSCATPRTVDGVVRYQGGERCSTSSRCEGDGVPDQSGRLTGGR